MRILMVHDTLAAAGGAERYIREISASLADRGFTLAFMSLPDQRPAWVHTPIYPLGPSMGWRSGRRTLPELKQALDAVKPDLIYIHTMREFWSPLPFKILVERAPSVLFVHDVRLFCPNETKIAAEAGQPCQEPVGLRCLQDACCQLGDEPLRLAWKRVAIVRWRLRFARRVGRLIVPSRYIAEELNRNGLRPDRVVVLPYFTERRPDKGASKPAADLLWVGRFDFDRTKGFEAFAEMLAHMKDLPWHAAVAGDGELLMEARALVDRLGLAPRITFLGRLTDGELDAWYARTRVVVVTSRVAESFCMVGIEAMAHGRPVVAFDAGGIREWLVEGVTGLAVPYGDSRSLAAATRRMLTEPGLAERFAEAGRDVVEQRFRQATHLKGLLSIFEAARSQWSKGIRVRELHRFRRAMGVIS